jgi:hypothetical protein
MLLYTTPYPKSPMPMISSVLLLVSWGALILDASTTQTPEPETTQITRGSSTDRFKKRRAADPENSVGSKLDAS